MLSQEQELVLSEYSGLYDIVVPQDNLLRRINALIDFSFISGVGGQILFRQWSYGGVSHPHVQVPPS